MSASLVGSEMCIRDSISDSLTINCTLSTSSTSERSCRLAVPRSQRSPVAVSYTHLTLPTICSV
eukprot:740928-Alexandrium_andersonii.AAC.1